MEIARYLQLYIWRLLTSILSYQQRRSSGVPPPSFRKNIPARQSKPGKISLVFNTPKDYKRNASQSYPVVVNFHGGGFSIGTARDDETWAASMTERGAVVVSVEYRLVPKNPLPIAFEDGLDAIVW